MKTKRWQTTGGWALLLMVPFLLVTSAATAGNLQAEWKDGLRLTAADKSIQLKIGGRIQNDWVFHTGDDDLTAALGDFEDGTEFRRMRMFLSGTIHEVALFKIQYDFASGAPVLKDGYVGIQGLPGLGTLKVGHVKEPFGLEELTSSKYNPAVERGLPVAFAPSRNTGILAGNRSGPVAWAAGIFRDTGDDGSGTGSGEYNATARFVANPWEGEDGTQLLHVGVAGSLRNPSDNAVSYSARPENHLAEKYVSTGTLASDRVVLVGVEGALVNGPVSLQGEYMMSSVTALGSGEDASFAGFYVFGSYFLTGESRPYKKSSSTFSRVKPHENFSHGGGAGAWELLARYSRLDLDDDDAGVAGGTLDDVTVGVNWYLNPNFRVAMNYVHADLADVGSSNALLMRFQTDF